MDKLYLSDVEFTDMRASYTSKATDIENELQSYLDNVHAVIDERHLQGRAAETLLSFAELVEETIRGELEYIMLKHQIHTGVFVDSLSEQDDAEL